MPSVFRKFVRPSLPPVQKAIILHGIVRRVYFCLVTSVNGTLSGLLVKDCGGYCTGILFHLDCCARSSPRAIKITGIFKATTLWFKALNNTNITEHT